MVGTGPREHIGWNWPHKQWRGKDVSVWRFIASKSCFRPAAWGGLAPSCREEAVKKVKEFAQRHRGRAAGLGAQALRAPVLGGKGLRLGDATESSPPRQGSGTPTNHVFCPTPIFPIAPFPAPFLGIRAPFFKLLLEPHCVPSPSCPDGRSIY